MELEIDLRKTNIRTLQLERRTDGELSIEFSVEGEVRDVDEATVKEALEANALRPVKIVIEAE